MSTGVVVALPPRARFSMKLSPMVGPQTANREKKNPPENEFRRVGMCCRAGRIESVIAFLWDHARRLPIEYGVYTKKEDLGTWDGGSAEMVQNSSDVLYIVRFCMLCEII